MTEGQTMFIVLLFPVWFWMLKTIRMKIQEWLNRPEEEPIDPETLKNDSINQKTDELSELVQKERQILKFIDELQNCEPEKRLTSVSIGQGSDKPYTLLLDGSERSAEKYREWLDTELQEIRTRKAEMIHELNSLIQK